jgi:hypothetical protein
VDVNCSDILGTEHASAIDLAIYANVKLPYNDIQCFDCRVLL